MVSRGISFTGHLLVSEKGECRYWFSSMSVMSLLIAGELDLVTFKGPFQNKPFCFKDAFYSLYECCNLQALHGSASTALISKILEEQCLRTFDSRRIPGR